MKFSLCLFVILCVLLPKINSLQNLKKFNIRCETFITCESCISNECGWCYSTGKCSNGNEIGVSGGYCPYYLYETTICKVPECKSLLNENACNSQENNCSWCKSKKSCVNKDDININIKCDGEYYFLNQKANESIINKNVTRDISSWVNADSYNSEMYYNYFPFHSVNNPSGLFSSMINKTKNYQKEDETIYNINNTNISTFYMKNKLIEAKENAFNELKKMFSFKVYNNSYFKVSFNLTEIDEEDISVEHYLIYKKMAGNPWLQYLKKQLPNQIPLTKLNSQILGLFMRVLNSTKMKKEKKMEIENELSKVKFNSLFEEFNPNNKSSKYCVGSEIELLSYVNSTFLIIQSNNLVGFSQFKRASFFFKKLFTYYIIEFPLYNNYSDIMIKRDTINNYNLNINSRFQPISKKLKFFIKNENEKINDTYLISYTINYPDNGKKNEYGLFSIKMNNFILNNTNSIMCKKVDSISNFGFVTLGKGDYEFDLIAMDIFDKKDIPVLLKQKIKINNKINPNQDIYAGGNDISDFIRFKQEDSNITYDFKNENINQDLIDINELNANNTNDSMKLNITNVTIDYEGKINPNIISYKSNETKHKKYIDPKQDFQDNIDKEQDEKFFGTIRNKKKNEQLFLGMDDDQVLLNIDNDKFDSNNTTTTNNSTKAKKEGKSKSDILNNKKAQKPIITFSLFKLPPTTSYISKQIKIPNLKYEITEGIPFHLISLSFKVSSPKNIIIKPTAILTLQEQSDFSIYLFENSNEQTQFTQNDLNSQLIQYRKVLVKTLKPGKYEYMLKYRSNKSGTINMIRNKWDIISIDILILDL